jgi:hypothetical protein
LGHVVLVSLRIERTTEVAGRQAEGAGRQGDGRMV